MKKVLVSALIVSILCLFGTKAFSSTIAVVNLGKIMTNCKAGQDAKAKIDSLIAAKKIIMNRKVSEIQKLAKQLQNKKLSKAEKEKETAVYQDKIKELQRYKGDAADEVRNKEMMLSNKIINDVIKIIKKYALLHKLDAVLEVGRGISVVYWNDKLDITNNIIKIYDKQYSSKK